MNSPAIDHEKSEVIGFLFASCEAKNKAIVELNAKIVDLEKQVEALTPKVPANEATPAA